MQQSHVEQNSKNRYGNHYEPIRRSKNITTNSNTKINSGLYN